MIILLKWSSEVALLLYEEGKSPMALTDVSVF